MNTIMFNQAQSQEQDLRIKVFEENTLQEGAELCLKWGLYVQGWLLKPTLHGMATREKRIGQIAVCFVQAVPVALVLHDPRGMLMAFCHQSHRRNGYCSMCLKELTPPPYAFAKAGIIGSQYFWKQNKIYIQD